MFSASDGTLIDIKADLVPHHRVVMAVWPCMTGSTAMYRLPAAEFTAAGISVIQYNPRGHGGSGGQFDVEQCIADLQAYLESLKLQDAPLWMIGHSAGASCVLRHGATYGPAHRYILVSPVLDSIGSYRYLYAQGRQVEANLLISALSTDKDFMLPILENDRWMEPDVWQKQLYREKFDRISAEIPVGTLMQKLFIEGYNTFRDLELLAKETLIILPVEDRWYPMDLTNSLAKKSNIRVETISGAKDHYFTGAWKHVWRRVLELIIQDANPCG